MGWERKRGKIEEFNRLLRGATDTSFAVSVGDLSILPDVKYCITLDSDTRLPRGVARELIGIIIHPLNRPTFDPRAGRVTEGYGVLQPRISVTFMSAAGSLFARLYSGHTGVDPYTTAVSDTYQDLFAEGIFTGKGLYDVDAFIAALEDSVPENALLSHDLFEGLHARVALVSDVELVDDYPSSVLSHARRQHRWVRGDWQILFWLFPFVPSRLGLKRNPLTAIGRWKILDNLRRSLVAPALLALLVAGWLILPGQPRVWTAIVVVVAASQLLPVLARLLIGPGRSQSIPVFLTNLRRDATTAVAQVLLSLTLLAFHAFDSLHAISLTLVRLVVTKRRLLEWETAASTAARAAGLVGSRGLEHFVIEMMASPVTAGVTALAVALWRRDAFVTAAPFLLLWLSAPVVAYRLSVPAGPRVRPLRPEERARLRRTARNDLALLRRLRHRGGWVAGARQLPGGRGRRAGTPGAPYVAHQHRHEPAVDAGGPRSRLPAHRSSAGTAGRDAARGREPRALPGASVRTGTTPPRGRRSIRGTSPRWTAAISRPRSSRLIQGLHELEARPQTAAQRLEGLADTAAVLRTVSSSSSAGSDTRRTIAAINSLARGHPVVGRGRGVRRLAGDAA